MARIGVMTTELDGATFAEVVDNIVEHKITSVQLQLGSVVSKVSKTDALLRGLDILGDHLSEELAQGAAGTLQSRGIEVAAVDGTYNMIHPDPERRDRNRDHLINLIRLAPLFGTSIVTVCTGTREDIMWRGDPDNQSVDAWADLVEQLGPVVGVAEQAGVVLAFEPEYNNVVNTAERARKIMNEIGSPALKVLMDAANLFHEGDLQRMDEHLDAAFALVGDDIVLAHAKDLDHDGDAGGRAAGQGLLDYDRYLSLLQRYGFDGTIVLHQLTELAPDRLDVGFDAVRSHAPRGYLTS